MTILAHNPSNHTIPAGALVRLAWNAEKRRSEVVAYFDKLTDRWIETQPPDDFDIVGTALKSEGREP